MTGDTHILRRLGKDITLSELRYMSDERGMSYKEIAEQLGTTYQTILRYLGPKRKKRTNAPAEVTPSKKVWAAARSLTRLTGVTHEYQVDVHAGLIEMRELTPGMPLTAENIDAMINQLTYIRQMFRTVGK